MAPDPVRAALNGHLTADATLIGLLSASEGIYHREAKQGAQPPYLIFNRQAGTSQWTYGMGNERAIWLVKGVTRGRLASQAEAIDARCQELLHKTQIDFPGGTLSILRESAVDYGEASDGEPWQHIGSLYRIFT